MSLISRIVNAYKRYKGYSAAGKKLSSLIAENGMTADREFLQQYINTTLNYIPKAFFMGNTRAIKSSVKTPLSCFNINNGYIDILGCKIPMPADDYSGQAVFLFEFDDLFLPYFVDDEEVLQSLMTVAEGPYEKHGAVLEKGDVVFDCGANMGYFSAIASAKGCTAYAFEAIPVIIEKYLAKTSALNENINICPYAVSDNDGELDFYMAELVGASADKPGQHGEKLTVPCISLDSFVEKNGIDKVDFIKADIEGSERYMLAGAKRVLKEFAPKLSICTYHKPDDPEVIRKAILDANPHYIITEQFKKLYAYVKKG